jgi:hypothetical protein
MTVRPFAGAGAARLGQDNPDNRNPDAAINDRNHIERQTE